MVVVMMVMAMMMVMVRMVMRMRMMMMMIQRLKERLYHMVGFAPLYKPFEHSMPICSS